MRGSKVVNGSASGTEVHSLHSCTGIPLPVTCRIRTPASQPSYAGYRRPSAPEGGVRRSLSTYHGGRIPDRTQTSNRESIDARVVHRSIGALNSLLRCIPNLSVIDAN